MSLVDVLIVGAGPAGLTLACDLQRRGVSFRLIEQLNMPVIASKGKGLQPRTLEVFHDLGIIDEVLEAGGVYPPIRYYKADKVLDEKRMMEIHEPSEEVPYPNTIMLPQWKTESVLTDRLKALGGTIERGCSFESLTQTEEKVTVTLGTGGQREDITARYVVAADGGRSGVRKALGISLSGETPDLPGC